MENQAAEIMKIKESKAASGARTPSPPGNQWRSRAPRAEPRTGIGGGRSRQRGSAAEPLFRGSWGGSPKLFSFLTSHGSANSPYFLYFADAENLRYGSIHRQ